MTDKTEQYNAHGTVPHPLSTRVSWWPENRAPAQVRTMCDSIWHDRDTRVQWWLGCCSVAENPSGFPVFHHIFAQAKVGRYWWGLAYQRGARDLAVHDVRDDLLAEVVAVGVLGPHSPVRDQIPGEPVPVAA